MHLVHLAGLRMPTLLNLQCRVCGPKNIRKPYQIMNLETVGKLFCMQLLPGKSGRRTKNEDKFQYFGISFGIFEWAQNANARDSREVESAESGEESTLFGKSGHNAWYISYSLSFRYGNSLSKINGVLPHNFLATKTQTVGKLLFCR